MYRLTKEEYSKMVTNAVTLKYKKVSKKIKDKINIEGKRLLSKE